MIVVCKVAGCPYKSGSGFCRNRVVKITPNGNCGHLYDDRGQVRRDWAEKIEEEFMDPERQNADGIVY